MTTFDQHKNLGYALVSVAPAPALTGGTLTVAAGFGALFPVAPFNCTVWPPAVAARQSNAEIVRVTARVGDVMTITRAQEGTTAKAIAVGWQFANTITVKDLTDVENAVTTIETTGVFDGDPAGGDLAGTFPNPTLVAIGAATGPIGDGTDVPVVTIDSKGRVTALTSTPITGAPPSGAAGGVLSGTYPNPGFAVDMATQAELDALAAIAVLDGDAAGGVLSGTYPNPGFAVDMATQAELDAAIATLDALCVIKLPTTDARNEIQPSAATVVPLTLKGFAAQTDDLLQIQDSTAAVLSRINELGWLGVGADPTVPVDVFRAVTGDQTLDGQKLGLRSVVNFTSPGGGGHVQQSMVANYFEAKFVDVLDTAIASDHLIALEAYAVMDIPIVSPLGDAVGASAAYLRADTLATNTYPVDILRALFVETRHGAPLTVPEAYGGYFTNSIYPGTSTGTVTSIFDVSAGYGGIYNTATVTDWNNLFLTPPYLANVGSIVTNYYGMHVGTNGAPAGHVVDYYGVKLDNPTVPITGTKYAFVSDGGQSRLSSGAATEKPLIVRGAAAQTGDLTEWQNSAATILSRINKQGWLGVNVDPAASVDVLVNVTGNTATDPDILPGIRSITNYTSPSGNTGFTAVANLFQVRYVNVLNTGNARDDVVAIKGHGLLDIPLPNVGDNVSVYGGQFWAETTAAHTYPVDILYGVEIEVRHASPRTVNQIYGANFVASIASGAGAVANMTGISSAFSQLTAAITVPIWNNIHGTPPFIASASGVITNYYGVRIEAYGGGAGHVVDYYGVKLDNPTTTITGTKYAFVADGGQSRLSAGAATEKPLVVRGFAAQSANLTEWQTSAAALLVNITAAGVLQFGSTSDTNLYRSAADTLKTDDSLIVAGTTFSHLGSSLGFLNAVPVAQQAASAISTLWTALKNYGLLTAGSTPPSVGTGTVTSVTATDGSIVVTGTATDPTIATGALNAIATAHPPVAAVALNAQKITGLADGSASSDAAAFGQIATGLATAVILTPTTDARNVIQPSAATVTPLTVKGAAAQTDPLQEWTDSTPTTLLSVLAGGAVEMLEQTVPATPGANRVRMFSRDSGGGLTQIVAVFPSGNTVVIAEDF